MAGNGTLWLILGGGALTGIYLLTSAEDAGAAATGASPSAAGGEPPEGQAPGGTLVGGQGRAQPAPSGSPAAGDREAGKSVTAPAAPPDERTALARVIRSEAGSHTEAERLAVAWVARNRARKAGTSIARLVCSPSCGPGGEGRPMSSRRAARDEDLALADVVLASSTSDDPTRGANNAFEPALQDQLFKAKRAGYTKSAAEVRARWLRSSDYYGTVGRWELYGPKGGGVARPQPSPGLPKRPEPYRHVQIAKNQPRPAAPARREPIAQGHPTPPHHRAG